MNLPAGLLEEAVRDFSQDENHDGSQMCIVIVMSHGDNGVIFGTDGNGVEDEALVTMFSNENAPSLVGKPKLFVFAHCRGPSRYPQPQVEHDGPQAATRPLFEDITILYPTVPGYVAFRNITCGSWYVNCLCEAIMDWSHKLELHDLVKLTQLFLAQHEGEKGDKQSSAVEERHFYKKLYFNPGLHV